MTKKMPKTIYVKWTELSNDEPYLSAGEDMYGMIEIGEVTTVGTYQLVETTTAEMVVKTAPPKKAR